MAILLLVFVMAAVVAAVLVLTLRRRPEQRGFEVTPVPPADEGKR